MGYFKDLDTLLFLDNRNARLECKKCGKVYRDTSGRFPDSQEVKFDTVKGDGIKCTGCGGEEFSLTAYVSPTIISNEYEEFLEEVMTSAKTDSGEVDEEED